MREELVAIMEGIKRFLSVAADLIVLNVIVILCCVPVITAGAACVAGYAYLLRILRGVEQGFHFQSFFEDFKKAFRTVTPAWLLVLLCYGILAGDYYFAVYLSEPVNQFFLIFSIVMAVGVSLAAMWLFPLMARYHNTIRGHFKNAILMAIASFPRTLIALLLQVFLVAWPLLVPDVFIYFGWVWVMVGFSLPMYCTAMLFRKALDSMPKKEEVIGQD